MRPAVIAYAVLWTALIGAAPAAAQEVADSLDALRAAGVVRSGDTVYVTDTSGQTIKGRLADLTASGIAVDTGLLGDRRRLVPAAAIERIQRADSLANGALIGVGAGIAAAAITPAAMCDLPDSECSIRVFAFVGVPLAVAAVVGSILVDRAIKPTVFRRAGGGTVRLRLVPRVSPFRAALMLALGF